MTIAELMGRFSSVERLKKGGQKLVFRARTHEGETVALKIISASNDPRVLQEIDIVKDLSLPNVPQIIESGFAQDESINEDVLYIIEEFIEGKSLRDWLAEGSTFDLPMAYHVLEVLLLIETSLEEKRILHRDINPNNIIVCPNNSVYLIDFGLAKNLNGASLTLTANPHGPFTPGYAPREQFSNIKNAQDVRTDLFQIGVTVYEGCTGRNPFVVGNETVYQIMSRTESMIPPTLTIGGDSNGMFAQLINMLMAKNQSQRPNSAKDAMRYLRAIKSTLFWEA